MTNIAQDDLLEDLISNWNDETELTEAIRTAPEQADSEAPESDEGDSGVTATNSSKTSKNSRRKRLYVPTPTQVEILKFVGITRAAYSEHIAMAYKRSPNTVRKHVLALEDGGYLQSELMGFNHKLYYLTPKGKNLLINWGELSKEQIGAFNPDKGEKLGNDLGITLSLANLMAGIQKNTSWLKVDTPLDATRVITEAQIDAYQTHIHKQAYSGAGERELSNEREARYWKYDSERSCMLTRKPTGIGDADEGKIWTRKPDLIITSPNGKAIAHIEAEMRTKGLSRYRKLMELYTYAYEHKQFEGACWFFGDAQAYRDFKKALEELEDTHLKSRIVTNMLILPDGREHLRYRDQF